MFTNSSRICVWVNLFLVLKGRSKYQEVFKCNWRRSAYLGSVVAEALSNNRVPIVEFKAT